MTRHEWRLALLAAIGGLAIGLVPAGVPPVWAISAEEKAKLDKGAQETLDEMQQLLDEDTVNSRRSCAMGGAPGWVAERRAHFPTMPFSDASGMCVSILGSKGKDGQLSELYREVLARLGGDVTGAGRLPGAIGAAVLADKRMVAIGNDKAMAVKPALAFDAGFTVAYQAGSASHAQEADAESLQGLAEACLGQHQEAGTCFSAGYLYGAAAFRGKTLLAR